MTKLKMYEKKLYPAVEKFLKTKKNCLAEYVGSELSLKRGRASLRADVFGVSNQDEQIIYLCEGKKELKRRSFGKVVGDAVELLKYADYVYIFGSPESFENNFLPSVKTLTKNILLFDIICFTEEGLRKIKSAILLN